MPPPARARHRLDQILSRYGYCSRREAAAWLKAGRVRVGDETPKDPAAKVDPATVLIDGTPVEGPDGLLIMLHKPLGCVCSHDTAEGPRVYDLLPARWLDRNPPITSVGRLDRDTSGLLLLTDLGEWVHRWTSPRHHVEKVYEATLDVPARPEWVGLFASGTLLLPGEPAPCRPATLEITGGHEVRLTLVEGRFHQVRRMFEAVGARVLRLHRPRFGDFTLGDLPEGAYRILPLPCSG